jgi:hypothetical protein
MGTLDGLFLATHISIKFDGRDPIQWSSIELHLWFPFL